MTTTDLQLTLVQTKLHWEEPQKNRDQLEELLSSIGTTDIVVLPEMFTTGFSMNAVQNAEDPGGDTEQWMQALALKHNCAITGSIAVRENQLVYNRMLFVTPAKTYHYDKRHLFRMAGYDLRFPVWSRNVKDYDLALYTANWPAPRRHAWRTLLCARAIENQAYVVGVNRLGEDKHNRTYCGDSLAFDAKGEMLLDLKNDNGTASVKLSGAAMSRYRDEFPCWRDADIFNLS